DHEPSLPRAPKACPRARWTGTRPGTFKGTFRRSTAMIRLTDELLMAYADGALPDTEAASVASALEHDVEARAIVAEFRRTAERARAAYADIMTEAVPDNIIHSVLGTEMPAANVVDMARARK